MDRRLAFTLTEEQVNYPMFKPSEEEAALTA